MRWARGNVVQSIPFVDANRDDDAHSSVLVQQFTHLVCTSQSLPSLIENSPRLLYLLEEIADKKKNRTTQENKKSVENKTYGQTVHLKRNGMLHYPPGSNCLVWPFPHTVIRCCCRFFDGLANSSPAAAYSEVLVSGFTPTSA